MNCRDAKISPFAKSGAGNGKVSRVESLVGKPRVRMSQLQGIAQDAGHLTTRTDILARFKTPWLTLPSTRRSKALLP